MCLYTIIHNFISITIHIFLYITNVDKHVAADIYHHLSRESNDTHACQYIMEYKCN